jgi:hypothetical protein
MVVERERGLGGREETFTDYGMLQKQHLWRNIMGEFGIIFEM